MKNMRILTEEQKIFAEQNHMLVERFLWMNHLERAEFYDVVIFGYLEAVQEYLEKPELSKYPFSSIAWRKMRYSMIKEYIYRNCPKRNAPMGTYREDYDYVFSREQIYENVFGFDGESSDSTIATHIKNIRMKLEQFHASPIRTVWGIGYKWEP